MPRRAGQSGRAAAEEGRPSLPGRRLRLHFPRLSRAAAADPQIGRPAGQCRARLLQHAVEAPGRDEAGRQADPSGGGVRQIGKDLPHRFLSRLQGAPAGSAGRPDPAVPAHPRSGARLPNPLPGAGRLRGRRPDRHLRAACLRGQGDDHHRVVGQGPDAARRQRRRHVRHHEGPPHRPRRGDREVRRRAGEGDRGAGADRRLHRQRAGRAGHRRQDRGAVDRRIRRSRNAAQARRRDQTGQAPADADRQCRAGAAVEAAGDARPERAAGRAGRRARGARARLQAPDRLPEGDGVLHHHPPHRREERHRCERRSRRMQIWRRGHAPSPEAAAPPKPAAKTPTSQPSPASGGGKKEAPRRPHPDRARRRAQRSGAHRQDRPLEIRMRAHAERLNEWIARAHDAGRRGGRHRDHQPRRHAGGPVRVLAGGGAERGLLRAPRS